MSLEQIVALNIYRFHFKNGDLKNYHKMIKELMSDKVPNLPNYENFMKATNKSTVFILAFMNFLMEMNIKTESEIHYMDSTPITVCIETILRQNTNSFDTPIAELYTEHLGKIDDFDLINNWSLGRINVPESIITFLAKELKVTTDWLLTGKEETDQVIDTHLYKLAKEHEGVLKGFDCLDEEKQKAISKEIADSLELRRLQREAKLKK